MIRVFAVAVGLCVGLVAIAACPPGSTEDCVPMWVEKTYEICMENRRTGAKENCIEFKKTVQVMECVCIEDEEPPIVGLH